MNDSFLMRSFERIGHLLCVVESCLKRERSMERFAIHQFHDQGAIFDAVNLCGVGMVEPAPWLRARSAPDAWGPARAQKT